MITIPRLELQAAVLAVRLKNKTLDEIDIKNDSIRFWTDSQIALCYIKNLSGKFLVYIMNLLNEIRVNSNVEEWFFVPGELNPADHCTRYLPFSVLSLKSNWIAGPRFLCASSVIILKTESTQVEAEDVEKHTHLLINRENNSDISVLKWEHYSSYFKLLRHVAYILKMKRHWINVKRKRPEKINFKEQTVVEIKAAEHQIIAQAQIECYHEEQNSLRNNKPLQKTSTLLSLRPILTDNLLRVGGKVAHSFLPFDSKHQIILAKKHHLSELLIKDIHVRNCHSGRELTLNLLRERFWIIHAKSLIRRVLLNCSYCKRQRILPTPPLMSDLQAERVSLPTSPFIHTGIDYFGPLFVKFSRKNRSNQAVFKRYGAIFTCLASRALHIELVGDLSTDTFILALSRFTAKTGNPQTITSDNGANFIGAKREL